jgi:hypothetical protein
MSPGAQDALKSKVIEYGFLIQAEQQSSQARIRALQNRMLSEIQVEQWQTATTALDAILGKNGVIHVTETNFNIGSAGIISTGEISGSAVGHSQLINVNENAQAILQAFAQFKDAVKNDTSLTDDQRVDSLSIASDLEEEAKKPNGTWNLSKIRNGIAALKTLGAGAQTILSLYQTLHPLIAAYFNLPS